jgi:foldase protein PrsA
MKKKILVMVIALAIIGAIPSISYAQKGEEEVVAVVNGEEITKDALVQRLLKQLGKRILEQMADEILISQEAKKERVKVSKKEVAKKLEETKKRFPSEEAFKNMIERSGMTTDDVKSQIKIQLLVEKMVSKRVKVTEEEIKDYFDKNKGRLAKPGKVKLSHILVETEEKAKEVKKNLKKGVKFAKLAKEKSLDTKTKEKGGDLGFLEARQCRMRFGPAFEKAAFALKKGQVSEPVKARGGYHILWARGKEEAKEANFKEEKKEIQEGLKGQKMMEEMRKWHQELKEKAEIEIKL